MAEEVAEKHVVRGVRDALREQLAVLDRLGEERAAIELNSAIEILNARLGEDTSTDELLRLRNRFFLD